MNKIIILIIILFYFPKIILANTLMIKNHEISQSNICVTSDAIKRELFMDFAISKDKTKQQAWKVLQYAAYLDANFISIKIIKEVFPGNEKEITKAIQKLESLSLVSIITNSNNQEGFRVDPELQKLVLQSIKNYPNYSIGTEQLINNLFIVLSKLFPEVNNNPDVKWNLANSLQPHVQKILKQKFEWLTDEGKVNQAQLYYKLAYYYLIINVNFKQAVEYAESSLEIRRSLYENDDPVLASSLNLIGTIYKESGDGKQGLKYLELALKMRQQLYSKNHPHVAASLFTIGQTYRELGDTQKALEYTQMALAMNQKLYKGNHIETAKALNLIGLEYLNLGNFNKSLSYLQKSFEMFKALYGDTHMQIARLLNNIAYNYHKLSNYDESLKYAKLSIDINKKLYVNDTPEKIYPLRSYGAALIAVNRIEEGLIILHEALEMSARLGLDKHFITAFVDYNLGVGYLKRGDYQKALDYAKKSLNLRQEIYAKAKNHIEIIESLDSLGDIYLAMGNKSKVLECYQQALGMSLALSLEHLPKNKEIQQKIKELL